MLRQTVPVVAEAETRSVIDCACEIYIAVGEAGGALGGVGGGGGGRGYVDDGAIAALGKGRGLGGADIAKGWVGGGAGRVVEGDSSADVA